MSDHDETPKIVLIDLTAIDEIFAHLRANYRPVEDTTFHSLDPFAGISGSMGSMEEGFFAFGAMGGTNFPSAPELELLMDRSNTNPTDGRDWNKYIFQLTDGPAPVGNHEECLARFLKAHSTDDSPQSEPEGS